MKLTQFLMEEFFPVTVKREGNAFYISNSEIESLSMRKKFTRAETAHVLELLRLMNINIQGSSSTKEVDIPTDEEFKDMFNSFNRNEITMAAMPLVLFTSRGLSTKYDIPLDEVSSYGYEALINCIDEFYSSEAYKKNISFSVVALLTVFEAILKGIISETVPTKLETKGINPIDIFKSMNRVSCDLGGYVLPIEVINDAEVHDKDGSLLNMIGLKAPRSLYDYKNVAIKPRFSVEDDSYILLNAIQKLPPREKEILLMRVANLTQEEIANKLGITQSYISRIQKRAIELLKLII